MINFKDRELAGPSAVIVAALVILLCTAIFYFAVPEPTVAGLATKSQRNKTQLVTDTEQAKERAKSDEAATQAQIWEGDPENVEARALAELTNHAAAGKLQMSAFRPEKTVSVNGLLEVPFNVQVAGPYLSILSFLRSLDASSTKIALRSIQVAASGGNSSDVTATVGFSVYCADTTVVTPKPASTSTTATAQAPTGGARG